MTKATAVEVRVRKERGEDVQIQAIIESEKGREIYELESFKDDNEKFTHVIEGLGAIVRSFRD
jgi:hypothetical protein